MHVGGKNLLYSGKMYSTKRCQVEKETKRLYYTYFLLSGKRDDDDVGVGA